MIIFHNYRIVNVINYCNRQAIKIIIRIDVHNIIKYVVNFLKLAMKNTIIVFVLLATNIIKKRKIKIKLMQNKSIVLLEYSYIIYKYGYKT